MERAALLALARQHRDDWADELRERLIEQIYQDAHSYLTYELDVEVEDQDIHIITQMMEESITLSLQDVTDIQ